LASEQYTAMLHTNIGIGTGIAKSQYYWILGGLLGIILTTTMYVDKTLQM